LVLESLVPAQRKMAINDGKVLDTSVSIESKRDNVSEDQARECGHRLFPLPPPKKTKREETLVVGVIRRVENDIPYWLMVRRPSIGLLANQWEFPSTLLCPTNVKTAERKRKASKPTEVNIDVDITNLSSSDRTNALQCLLSEMFETMEGIHLLAEIDWYGRRKSTLHPQPLEHVFSHVRHTMWIESIEMQAMKEFKSHNISIETIHEWIDCQKRQLRWMNELDMRKVGVTAGVTKILHFVTHHTHPELCTGKQPTALSKQTTIDPLCVKKLGKKTKRNANTPITLKKCKSRRKQQ
jgi:hypothetical protein